MDISVIIVTFNQEATVGRAIDSVLAQDFAGEMEIVIGDDCSTDGTGRVCREYAERYPDKIRYVRRERNIGLSANYFDCIRRCSGRYIADCAGDDHWVLREKLTLQHALMEREPEVALVHTAWRACAPDGTLSAPKTDPLNLCTALYRRDSVLKMMEKYPRFFQAGMPCEDLQIVMLLGSTGKIAMMPEVTLHYSVGRETVTHSSDPSRLFRQGFATLRLRGELLETLGRAPAESEERFPATLAYLVSCAMNSLDYSLRDEITGYVRAKKVRLSPKSAAELLIMRWRPAWRLIVSLKRKIHA